MYQFDFIRELQEAADRVGIHFDPAEKTELELNQLYDMFCTETQAALAVFALKYLK